MTEERVAPWIVRQIGNHLWAILAAVGAAYGGYVTGMTTISHRLDALEARMAKVEHGITGLQQTQAGAVRNLDRINDRLGISPPQPLENNQ